MYDDDKNRELKFDPRHLEMKFDPRTFVRIEKIDEFERTKKSS